MQTYLNLLSDILTNGDYREDRTKVGTYSVFGRQLRFNLKDGFPILTTKKIHWRSVVYELLWFIKGDTNTKYLEDNKVTIWREWQDDNGDLGPVYGKQWRNFGADGITFNTVRYDHGSEIAQVVSRSDGVDQLANVIKSIKENPASRRHVVSAWNPIEMPKMALPPCHCLYQFYVSKGKLSCQLYQRSCDALTR